MTEEQIIADAIKKQIDIINEYIVKAKSMGLTVIITQDILVLGDCVRSIRGSISKTIHL